MVGISSFLTFFILLWKLFNSRNKVQPAGPSAQLIPTSAQQIRSAKPPVWSL
jgi:hypothetical protein